ncbi:MAG TPA: hypothetical protein VF483_10755 [Gemmatimonadaceae bacterium]
MSLKTVFLLCLPAVLYGQNAAESRYIAAKDSVIRSLSPPYPRKDGADLKVLHDSALKDMERQLRDIVGAVQVTGFPGPGRIYIDDLFPGDLDSGSLDGLFFTNNDKTATLIVTTQPLLVAWLARSRSQIPRDPVAALRSVDFYTFAFWDDRATVQFGRIQLPDAARLGIASALLVLRAQDFGLEPHDVMVSVVRRQRVYLIDVRDVASMQPPAPCLAIRRHYNALSGEQLAQYWRAHQDAPLSSAPRDAEAAADMEYRACYAKHLATDPALSRLTAQVRSLVAALPPQ